VTDNCTSTVLLPRVLLLATALPRLATLALIELIKLNHAW
jgi:hypothetical protein